MTSHKFDLKLTPLCHIKMTVLLTTLYSITYAMVHIAKSAIKLIKIINDD